MAQNFSNKNFINSTLLIVYKQVHRLNASLKMMLICSIKFTDRHSTKLFGGLNFAEFVYYNKRAMESIPNFNNSKPFPHFSHFKRPSLGLNLKLKRCEMFNRAALDEPVI